MSGNYEISFNDEERKIVLHKGAVFHTVMMDEVVAFTSQINITMANDPSISSILPIDASDLKNLELFKKCSDGRLLAALANQIEPDTIDMRVLRYDESKPEAFKQVRSRENISLVLNSLIALGVGTSNVNAMNFLDYRNNLHLILGVAWQLLKRIVLGKIDLHVNKNLVLLMQEGETLEDLLALPAEKLLQRWVNYQLKKAGCAQRMENLSSSLRDGIIYINLLDHIGGKNTGLLELANESVAPSKRAEAIVLHAKERYGIDIKVSSSFITAGLERINTIFLASVYNANPHLEEVKRKIDFEDDPELEAESKAIRNWMLSMLPGEEIGDLYEVTSRGVIPLKILDKLKGVVDWSKIKKNPKNNMERIMNVGQTIEVARKSFSMKFTNFNEISMAEKKKKMVNDFFMVIMLQHSINILSNLQMGGKKYEEKDVFAWVKTNIARINDKYAVNSYRHPNWKNGTALIALLASCHPEVINWEFIKVDNPSEEDRKRNISYALTVARKLGAVIFCSSEDILSGSSRMVQLFCIEVMKLSLGKA